MYKSADRCLVEVETGSGNTRAFKKASVVLESQCV